MKRSCQLMFITSQTVIVDLYKTSCVAIDSFRYKIYYCGWNEQRFFHALSHGHGGRSSGCALDYRLRGPGLDSHCHWAISLISLSYLSISGAPLIRSLEKVQHYWISTFQENEKSLAVQLEAKQAYYALNEQKGSASEAVLHK